jgi:hypothetical protein
VGDVQPRRTMAAMVDHIEDLDTGGDRHPGRGPRPSRCSRPGRGPDQRSPSWRSAGAPRRPGWPCLSYRFSTSQTGKTCTTLSNDCRRISVSLRT